MQQLGGRDGTPVVKTMLMQLCLSFGHEDIEAPNVELITWGVGVGPALVPLTKMGMMCARMRVVAKISLPYFVGHVVMQRKCALSSHSDDRNSIIPKVAVEMRR